MCTWIWGVKAKQDKTCNHKNKVWKRSEWVGFFLICKNKKNTLCISDPCSSILKLFKHDFHTSLWEWVKIPTCGQLNIGSEGWSNVSYITKTVGFAGLGVQNCFYLLTWGRRGNPHSPTHIFTFQEHSEDWIMHESQHWCQEGPWMAGHLRSGKRKATNKPPEAQKHKWPRLRGLCPGLAFNLQTEIWTPWVSSFALSGGKKDIRSHLYHHSTALGIKF